MTFLALFGVHVHAFQIRYLRRHSDNVRLKDQPIILHQDPDSSPLNSSGSATTKPRRVFLKRTDSAFFEGHQGIYCENLFQIVKRRWPEIAYLFLNRQGFTPFEQQFATNPPCRYLVTGVVFPEFVDYLALAPNQV